MSLQGKGDSDAKGNSNFLEINQQDVEILKKRIEEQNKLINLLKTRNESSAEKLKHQKSLRVQEGKKHCLNASMLQELRDDNDILRRRYEQLHENQAELIKIKDEYKSRNRALEEHNKQLQNENTHLFSNELIRSKTETEVIHKQLTNLQRKHELSNQNHRDAEIKTSMRMEELEKQLETVKRTTNLTINTLQHQCQSFKKDLNETEKCLNIYKSRLQATEQRNTKSDADLKELQKSGEKQKQELLKLAYDRGRQVQQKTDECNCLQQELQDMRNRLAEYQEQFQRQTREVLRDEHVQSLTRRLATLKNEFDEHKTRSKYLQEKMK